VKDLLMAEFDQEMAVTRQLLARLPEAAFAWKPHERSMSLGGLATHLAQIPHWGESILLRTGYDLVNDQTARAVEHGTVAEVLRTFDAHTREMRKSLSERTDAELSVPWSLSSGGQLVMSMPKVTALRRFLFNHLVHHRGQLSVYLRLQNVPLPPIYGPTADAPV
jgi:uncharacterized damage-inducible protein DinB